MHVKATECILRINNTSREKVRAAATIALVFQALVACFALTSTVFAKEEGPPSIDLQHHCRAAQRAIDMTLGTTSGAYELCMKSEQAARDQLTQIWSSVTAANKSQCVVPTAFSPSYVEWLACIELFRDVDKTRKEAPTAIASGDDCPVLQYRSDGSIVSVLACPLQRYRN
jgi:hypothetical protein